MDVTLPPARFGAIDYGYAVTCHKAQGVGVDRVQVLPHRCMHRNAVYVALSRHKESPTLYGRAGHTERLGDFIRFGQVAGHLDMVSEDNRLAESSDGGLVPGADAYVDPGAGGLNTGTDSLGLSGRADWQAMGSHLTRTGFAGDAGLMAVAERHVGLHAGRCRKGDPVLNPDVEDHRGYIRFPRCVADDLVGRHSVFRAEDVAGQLAGSCRNPRPSCGSTGLQ